VSDFESLKTIFHVFWAKESISALNFTLQTLCNAEKCINIDSGTHCVTDEIIVYSAEQNGQWGPNSE